MHLTPGTRLAQYEITGSLGSGGMGEVYRARDLRLNREVAIKVMADHIAADPVMRQRFEVEARAVAALSHPSILSIHELGLAEDVPFAVMELLEGETLRSRVDRGAIPWREAVSIGAAVAEGLSAAHAKGIVHRDLKPENVFLTSNGLVKVLDFGLALHRMSGANTVTAARTAAGVVLGTLGYMSPEQVTGERVDGRSDIFTAGCLLYEMVTARRLFGGVTPQEIVGNLLHDSLPDLHHLDPLVPPGLRAIVARCVDRHAPRRFDTAADLALALRALLSGSADVASCNHEPDACTCVPTPVAARLTPTASTYARAPVASAFRKKTRGKSLAVLPFVNAGADPQIEYLTDGITESIINSLSQLPKLRVVPRSLAFRYKGHEMDHAAIGRDLNVRTILTGRVTQVGDLLDIQAELVDAGDEAQLWGERFRRKLADVLLVQEEISWQISEALRLKLTGEQKKTLRKGSKVDPQAYQEYLRGRHLWHEWNAESFRRAIEHFERALSLDPMYALPYAGLGHAFAALSYYGQVPPEEGFPRARAAALRALELDGTLPEAHVTVGLERMFWAWDWDGAGQAFDKALELNPQLPLALSVRSIYYIALKRFDDALRDARQARELDPLSHFVSMGVAWVLHFSGRFDDAAREAEKVLALNPGFEVAGNVLISAHEARDRYEEAIAAIAGQRRCWGVTLDAPALLAAYRSGGAAAYWRERLAQMYRNPNLPAATAVPFAAAHVRAGEHDRAIEHVARLVESRAGGAAFIGVEPFYDALRGMPRYEALVSRVRARQLHSV